MRELELLREQEEAKVDDIRSFMRSKDSNCQVFYLPNPMPKAKVDYIFLAMEPSLAWANDEEDAKAKVSGGFRNFLLSWDDFAFHYSINKYLSPSYYVTDVSKAAMKVKVANDCRKAIYPMWVNLLQREIDIVGKDSCKVILVGNHVSDFIQREYLELPRPVAKTVLHYSKTAARKRKELPRKYEQEYEEFRVSEEDFLAFTERLLDANGVPPAMREWILNGLGASPTKLSDSRKELIFSYYVEFRELKGEQLRQV